MTTEPYPEEPPALLVHPDDVDLPEIKAKAAKLGFNVVASPYVRRGSAYVARKPKLP